MFFNWFDISDGCGLEKNKYEVSFLQSEFSSDESIWLLSNKMLLMKPHSWSTKDFAIHVDVYVRA